jgi:hypothetical protein
VFFAILHYQGVQLCLLRKYTGYPCLFCGSSRAAFFLLQGRLTDAFTVQPLASLALLLGAFTGTLFYAVLLIKRELLLLTLSKREKLIYSLAALVLALLNWVYLFLTWSSGFRT